MYRHDKSTEQTEKNSLSSFEFPAAQLRLVGVYAKLRSLQLNSTDYQLTEQVDMQIDEGIKTSPRVKVDEAIACV